MWQGVPAKAWGLGHAPGALDSAALGCPTLHCNGFRKRQAQEGQGREQARRRSGEDCPEVGEEREQAGPQGGAQDAGQQANGSLVSMGMSSMPRARKPQLESGLSLPDWGLQTCGESLCFFCRQGP